MRVIITQPSLFPWVGTLEKGRLVNTWVHLDHVAFQRKGYLHRFSVRDVEGLTRWITIPIGHQPQERPITEVKMPETGSWRESHFHLFETRYRRAPFYNDARSLLETVYHQPADRLVDLAVFSLAFSFDYLRLPKPRIVRSSELGVTTRKSELLADIVQAVGGQEYLFGTGGKMLAAHYLDVGLFRARGLDVYVMKYLDVPYAQFGPGFVPRLSILDTLACVGISGTKMLLQSSAEKI